MNNIMVDIETLGTAPGCLILSIGAVRFDDGSIKQSYYDVINADSCINAGLTILSSTIQWWLSQEDHDILEQVRNAPCTLEDALNRLSDIVLLQQDTKIWSNGADFDIPILGAAYKAVGLPIPWEYKNVRCYRTLKKLFPDIEFERFGQQHQAADDAMSQARHAIRIFQYMETSLNRRYRI
jgi:DNA polymerase III epsilon subunit-like protein